MKAPLATLFGFLIIIFSSIAFAYDGCAQGLCGDSICDGNQSSCQCVDPMCNRPWYSNCIDRAYCCEAFGNIGAR